MRERTVMCPILKKQIDDTVCYDIHMNVEGLLPDWGSTKGSCMYTGLQADLSGMQKS